MCGAVVVGVTVGAWAGKKSVDRSLYEGAEPQAAAGALLALALDAAGDGSWEQIAVARMYLLSGQSEAGQAILDAGVDITYLAPNGEWWTLSYNGGSGEYEAPAGLPVTADVDTNAGTITIDATGTLRMGHSQGLSGGTVNVTGAGGLFQFGSGFPSTMLTSISW